MPDQTFSLQDLIRTRQAGVFVGRAEPLRLFEQNLALAVDDPRRRFVFSVHGDAGTGKTTLVRQWGRVARACGHATGYVDEAALDIPSALELLSVDLADDGTECSTFTAKLAQYRKHRHTVDSDPGAPSGMSSLLTKSAVRIGLRAAEDLPLLGAFASEIDKDEAALQADQARAFLARRFARQQDIELLLSPADVLTAAFVKDLRTIAVRRPIAIFLDTFERTGQFLNDWLLELLAGRHGSLPPRLVFALSGQRPLDANQWADYLSIRCDIPLEVFTDAEARQLLSSRGIGDPATVETLLEVSGRLPVLLATLAESSAHGTETAGDPSETAVDRFLKWERNPSRRTAAVAGALPRRLDRDVLAVVAGESADFEWLRRLPFVVSHTDGYRYHDVVRGPMLRSLQRDSPQDWAIRHRALAAHYRERQVALKQSEEPDWGDHRWRDLRLEEGYHLLCAAGATDLPRALHDLLDSYGRTSDSAARWAQMILQAGTDADLENVEACGRRLSNWLLGGDEEELLLLTNLAADSSLDSSHRGSALAERSQVHERRGDYEAALADLDKADELHPDTHWIVAWRGSVHAELGHREQALADLTRGIDLYPDYEWALRERGSVLNDLGQPAEALADLDRAVALDPADPQTLVVRAKLHENAGRYSEAVADLDRALAVDSQDATVLVRRGEVHSQLKRYPEALQDLDRAIDLDPSDAWAFATRGQVFHDLDRLPDALADFDRAITLEPGSTWMLTVRGELFADAGDMTAALADLDLAVSLAPRSDWSLTVRGETRLRVGDYAGAVADLNAALAIDPDYTWALINRVRSHRALGQYEQAVDDLDRLLRTDPDSTWALIFRGMIRQAMGAFDEASGDFDRAVTAAPDSDWAFARRGEFRRVLGRHEEALDDFGQSLERAPDDDWVLVARGETYFSMGRYDEALADFAHADELGRPRGWTQYRRALIWRRQGLLSKAKEALQAAVDIERRDLTLTPPEEGACNLAVYLLAGGDHQGALEHVRRVMDAHPARNIADEGVADFLELREEMGTSILHVKEILRELTDASG